MALQERGFGGQKIIIPVVGSTIPSNSSDRLVALEIDPPVFVDASRRTYSMADRPAKRSMTYFADRTVYRVAFDGGPEVSLTVYPVYGKPDAVLYAKEDPLVRPFLRRRGSSNIASSDPAYGSALFRGVISFRTKRLHGFDRCSAASRHQAGKKHRDQQQDCGSAISRRIERRNTEEHATQQTHGGNGA